jgi:threonine dehydratase
VSLPGVRYVLEARDRIAPHVHRTPVLASSALDDVAGASLFFKCENFQKAGVFKARGAFNAVFSLSDEEAARGVVTSSSGNQAASLSLAAKTRGIPAYIAMPRIALRTKIAAVERYGGRIVWVEAAGEIPTSTEYEATADRIQRETGAAPVHPYDDARTIAGQGTCALELLEQAPDLDFVIAPVGGGGLLSGTAITVKSLAPKTTVLGAEPEMANDALLSLRAGTIVPQTRPRTVADGLRTSLGALTFPLIREHVDDIVTVSESSILAAMRTVWEVLKIVIEPSSAVAVAPLLEGGVPQARGKRVGIILSGGNVDLDSFPLFSSKGAVANEAR